MKRIAFVTPWYGENIPGGAEAEARRTAQHLFEAGLPVEVLTTCVRDFRSDWSRNYHAPGKIVEGAIPVRRFRVRRRDRAAFDAVNAKLMNGLSVTPREEEVYIRESIRSPALVRYISRHRDTYTFIFIPYMFGTTYWGLEAIPDRALLIPCLHDEAYARMDVFRHMVRQAHRLILHSGAELALAKSLYDLKDDRYVLMGEGVDTEWTSNGEAFFAKYGLEKPFILYAGRKDHGKNVETLISYFRRYRQRHGAAVDLVFIGGGDLPMPVAENEGIHVLGFVPIQDKYDAYDAAAVLCQPSLQESFSLVLMEAWVAETPALVHGNCAVTKEHCVKSHGGLFFTNYGEFELSLDILLNRSTLRAAMGRNGRRYVLENYHWNTIVERYRSLMSRLQLPNERTGMMYAEDY